MRRILITLFLAAIAVSTLPGGFRIWIVIGFALVCLFLGTTLILGATAHQTALEFVAVAGLPVVVGLVAMFAGYRDVDRRLLSSASAGRSTYEAGRRQARVPAYVGAGSSLVILAAAMIRQRRRSPPQAP